MDAPVLPDRHSIRYDGFDYSSAGAYFITICVRWGRSLLGEVRGGEMHLSASGEIVAAHWEDLPRRFPTVATDAFQVMPNHAHGVLWLDPVRASLMKPVQMTPVHGSSPARPFARPSWDKERPELGEIVRVWKAVSTRRIRQAEPALQFAWLRNYWDRIIRDEKELARIREYIRTNPQRWQEDQLHPDAPPNKWKEQWIEEPEDR